LYCEPASLIAAPTDSRCMFEWIFIKYIILGWTNSPVVLLWSGAHNKHPALHHPSHILSR
jgi:hypothetical protein